MKIYKYEFFKNILCMTYINIRIYIDKYEYFIWNKKKKKIKKEII